MMNELGTADTKTPKHQKTKTLKIIISGGGTGGHVFPAIAIANALKANDPNTEILFVGAQGKLEMEKVPQAGYPIKGLWISGFHRQLTMRNLLFPIKVLSSLWKARQIVKSFKPDVAIGVGGYASGPTLYMAASRGIPTVIQEQNSYPGITNKLLAKRVKKICVAYEGMDRFFPSEKLVFTGNPVRQDIWNMKNTRNEAVKYFNFHNKRKIIILIGGSLGARTLNEAMKASHELLAKNPDVGILWQAGKLYIEEFSKYATAQLENVQITAFIDRMDLAYSMADIVIGRAGALTVSELCLVGKPSVLVPSPNVAEDHQTMNAKALVDKGAAILVKDNLAKAELIPSVIALLEDEEKQQLLSQNIKQLAKPDATKEIVKQVYQVMNYK